MVNGPFRMFLASTFFGSVTATLAAFNQLQKQQQEERISPLVKIFLDFQPPLLRIEIFLYQPVAKPTRLQTKLPVSSDLKMQ